ncbi:MAG: hypothetical protein GF409_01175 [Candidatus Omnitrophica bacterium]|nr:hypothetical protein [Candidatus Omnitrophota bacterium]
MKEVVYKNISGNNPRKHEVSIEEITDSTRSRIAKKWITKYFIKDSYTSDIQEELKAWVALQKNRRPAKNCHILRHYDEKTGQNMIVCKVLGKFFVIKENTAYSIVYVNEIRIQILGEIKRDGKFLKKRF